MPTVLIVGGVMIVLSVAVLAAVWLVVQIVRDQARLRRTLDIQMFQVLVPKDIDSEDGEQDTHEQQKERIAVTEQFLSTLSNLPSGWWDRWLYGRPIVVFEIVARRDDVIVFYVGTERRFADHLEKQLYAHYPEADVSLSGDYTIFEPADTIRTGSLKLARAAHLPIATYKELEVDPMQSLTGALAKIQKGDAAVIQYVLQRSSSRTRRQAGTSARRTVRGKQGDVDSKSGMLARSGRRLTQAPAQREKLEQEQQQLTPRAQERVELVEHKASQQQFDVIIRFGVSARQLEEAERIFNAIHGGFAQYELPDLNRLQLKTPGKPHRFLQDLIFRIPRPRAANTLSTTEIASLFHFPLPTTSTPNILWRGAKIAPTPAGLPQTGVRLGTNVYRGIETPIYLAEEDRRRHLYMVGQTGTGKTTLFLNMIVQDIRAGHGVGVVDPHGDLIENVLLHIPKERRADVILFDPHDTEHPLGFNMLEAKDESQRDLIVNEIIEILQKLAARLNPESIGPMFEHYLRNALLALVEDPKATLVDVPRMFVDEEFRRLILAHNINPVVRQFWEQEFAQSQRGQMSADMLSYVISKLGRFISNRTIRNIIGQAQSAFDVRQVMDERKILLCNLSKGSLGEINSDLLGFVLVSKIQIAALGRSNVPEEERHDFYLYLDEFQNFTTDSIVTILSEARKYRLNLNLTHQFVEQLEDKIREAVFGNVGTIVSYRVGVEDAEVLSKQFEPVFRAYDLLHLEQFMAIVRLLAGGTPQRAFSLQASRPPAGGDAEGREAIREYSRQKYGQPAALVESEIVRRFQFAENQVASLPADGSDYLGESLFDVS